MDYDVFNGDADGICALLQLRREEPREAVLVTGVKRDIALLERVDAGAGGRVTVLDISMQKNAAALECLLARGVSVFYADHHLPGEIPPHPALDALIDTDPNLCTSLLIDRRLGGRHRAWAVTGAFGDNLNVSAREAARALALSTGRLDQLQTLGVCINYNGYGADIEDLHIPPAELYRTLAGYPGPLDFIDDPGSDFSLLREGYEQDIARAAALRPEVESEAIAVYLLPEASWARRVSGVFGNRLANAAPERAHAVLTRNRLGGYLVSVRAPLNDRRGAGQLCQQFESGGGREGAAGINHLAPERVSDFVDRFRAAYPD
ncbi:MAG: acetyltransferase [Candidatus Sedimenticola endophacoides]|nr:MAG: acetyltransferase [Candidatus Sedimenticola endophacoides]OQX35793.1 MAG: acetyltransferase [Candidatus Sedimenticola endophacoides]